MATKSRLNVNLDTELKQFEISLPKYYSMEDVAGENWRDGLDEMEDEWE